MYTPVCENTVTYEDKLMHWKNYMVFQDMKPIEYLEIGSLHGGSVLQFHNIFGNDVHSTCIDPYAQCDNYMEYQNEHETNYEIYKQNTAQLGTKNIHYRKASSDVLPTLQDNFYDVIYIDGNHNLCNILEDAVLCYRKLKQDGYMVLDDVNWGHGRCNTNYTVTAFINAYTFHKMILVYYTDDQAILKKL